jgi:hypothetical protein
MLSDGDLKYLHMRQVQKISETNNVVVHFHEDAGVEGALEPSVILGRRQLVLKLEKIAREVEPDLWAVRQAAAQNAREAREYLWPKTV